MTISVGNNGSGNTGNTIVLGVLSNGTSASAFNSTINFTAANGYLQSYSGLNLSGSGGSTTILNPTTPVIIGNVTNQETNLASGHYDTFKLNGTSSGNVISGQISNASGYSGGGGNTLLTVSNSNSWTLTGSNSYTGATSVNAGTLLIGGTGSLGDDRGHGYGRGHVRWSARRATAAIRWAAK